MATQGTDGIVGLSNMFERRDRSAGISAETARFFASFPGPHTQEPMDLSNHAFPPTHQSPLTSAYAHPQTPPHPFAPNTSRFMPLSQPPSPGPGPSHPHQHHAHPHFSSGGEFTGGNAASSTSYHPPPTPSSPLTPIMNRQHSSPASFHAFPPPPPPAVPSSFTFASPPPSMHFHPFDAAPSPPSPRQRDRTMVFTTPPPGVPHSTPLSSSSGAGAPGGPPSTSASAMAPPMLEQRAPLFQQFDSSAAQPSPMPSASGSGGIGGSGTSVGGNLVEELALTVSDLLQFAQNAKTACRQSREREITLRTIIEAERAERAKSTPVHIAQNRLRINNEELLKQSEQQRQLNDDLLSRNLELTQTLSELRKTHHAAQQASSSVADQLRERIKTLNYDLTNAQDATGVWRVHSNAHATKCAQLTQACDEATRREQEAHRQMQAYLQVQQQQQVAVTRQPQPSPPLPPQSPHRSVRAPVHSSSSSAHHHHAHHHRDGRSDGRSTSHGRGSEASSSESGRRRSRERHQGQGHGHGQSSHQGHSPSKGNSSRGGHESWHPR